MRFSYHYDTVSAANGQEFIADRIGFMLQGRLVMMKTEEELKGEDLNRLYVEYMHEHAGDL